MPAVTEPIRSRLQAEVLPAMKARDALRVSTLRTTLAAIANAEAVDASNSTAAIGLHANESARRHLDERQIRLVVLSVRDELLEAVDEMVAIGRPDLADERRHQADVLDAFLVE